MGRRGQARRGAGRGRVRRPATDSTRPGRSAAAIPTIDEAVALMERGRLRDAQAAAEAIAAARPRDPDAHQLLGMVAGRLGRFDDAAAHFRRLGDLVPADPRPCCREGTALMHAGRFEDAEAAFGRALERRPGAPEAVRGRAELAERRGDASAALAILEPLLADPATAADPATGLLRTRLLAGAGDHAGAVAAGRAALATPGVPPAFRRPLQFAIGRSLDRLGPGHEAEAAEAWAAANAAGARETVGEDPAALDREADAIAATFSAGRLARTAAGPGSRPTAPAAPAASTASTAGATPGARSRATTDAPLLVVGLPRSGSTLVEQILDAHPEACGAGETRAMLDVMATLSREHARPGAARFPAWWDDVDEPAMTRAGLAYVAGLEDAVPRTATGASVAPGGGAAGGTTEPRGSARDHPRRRPRRLVDKNLQNLPLVGAIAEMLPAARFVLCRRDPIDNGFSCWVNDLVPTAWPWTCRLDAIGRTVARWHRLGDHWARVLTDRVLVVEYEALVADPEGGSRRLLEFAGLPWDDSVLRFHETDRPVTTLSYDQVRRPVYRTSVRRSDRYRRWLEPMIEGMRAGGLDPDAPHDDGRDAVPGEAGDESGDDDGGGGGRRGTNGGHRPHAEHGDGPSQPTQA